MNSKTVWSVPKCPPDIRNLQIVRTLASSHVIISKNYCAKIHGNFLRMVNQTVTKNKNFEEDTLFHTVSQWTSLIKIAAGDPGDSLKWDNVLSSLYAVISV